MRLTKEASKSRLVIFLLGMIATGIGGPLSAHEDEPDKDASADAMLNAEARQVVDTLNAYAAAVQSANLETISEYMVSDVPGHAISIERYSAVCQR
jgi:hypothetical protein